MEKESKSKNLKQIEYLERDINIIKDILSGKLDNYTQHSFPLLKATLISYQSKLSQLRTMKSCEQGGL